MDPILKSLTLVNEVSLASILERITNTDKAISIGFLNQYAYNLISSSDAIKANFFDLDYLFRDGKGVELACLYNNIDPQSNLNGTDFIPRLISQLYLSNKEMTLFAYGTQQPWLDIGATSLFNTSQYYSLNGFKDVDCYLEHNLQYQTESLNVVVLAMGMPKQELIATQLKLQSKNKMIIICGGAILDFQAGRVKRAPTIFRKLGFEWLYRFTLEPKRLFSRYVVGIPLFFLNVYRSSTKRVL